MNLFYFYTIQILLFSSFLISGSKLAAQTIDIQHFGVITLSNDPNVAADFNTFETAHAHANEGDTIYIYGSPNSYGNATITKRITLIGPGYSEIKNENGETINHPAVFHWMEFSDNSAHSVAMGLVAHVLVLRANNIRIESNKINQLQIEEPTADNCFILRNFFFNKPTPTNSNSLIVTRYKNGTIEGWSSDPYHDGFRHIYFYNNILSVINLKRSAASSLWPANIIADIQHNLFYKNPTDERKHIIAANSNISNNLFVNTYSDYIQHQNNTNNSVAFNHIINYYPKFPAEEDLSPNTFPSAIGTCESGKDCGLFGGPFPYIVFGFPSIPRVSLNNHFLSDDYSKIHISAHLTPNNSPIGLIEYYFNENKLFGKGLQIESTAASGEISLEIPIDHLQVGKNTLYIRIKDYDGKWSFSSYLTFCKGPIASFSVSNSHICLGEELTISNNSTLYNESTKVLWEFDQSSSFVENRGNILKHLFQKWGTYKIALKLEHVDGCNDIANVEVKVSDIPGNLIIDGPTVLCKSPEKTKYIVNASGYPESSLWQFTPNTGIVSSTQDDNYIYIDWNPDFIGKSTITVTTKNKCGISEPSAPYQVDVKDYPIANFTYESIIKSKLSFTSTSMNADRFVWDMGDGKTRSGKELIYLYRPEGVYYVTLTAFNDICPHSLEKKINAFTIHNVIINTNLENWLTIDPGVDMQITSGESIMLGGYPTATGGAPPYQYHWTPATFLDLTNPSNPLATPVATTMYSLQVTDVNNCLVDKQVTVNVENHTSNLSRLGNSISVYPNPFKLSVAVESATHIKGIELFCLKGNLIKRVDPGLLNNTHIIIDLSDVPPGVYSLRIFKNESYYTLPIVKQ